MNVKVELWAFLNGDVRDVEIPDEEVVNLRSPDEILDKVFYYGQNDFQPRNFPSVSVGDVILLKSKRYIVLGVGFRELPSDEYKKFIQLPQEQRAMYAYKKA